MIIEIIVGTELLLFIQEIVFLLVVDIKNLSSSERMSSQSAYNFPIMKSSFSKPLLLFLLLAGSINLFAQKNPYKTTLFSLCDTLLPTQINNPSDPNYDALVCPSTNPENHPLHSRSSEAMYPFAIAYKLTGKTQYRDAAIKLGNWLTTIQDISGKRAGGWSESCLFTFSFSS
jgi:hypothetical protein